MTLEKALEMGQNSAEARVAEQEYQAVKTGYYGRRLGFYLPRLSLDLTTPGYSNDRFLTDYFDPDQLIYVRRVGKSTGIDFSGGLKLSQDLISGGNYSLALQGGSNNSDNNLYNSYRQRNSILALRFEQPIFKISPGLSALRTAEIDYEKGKIAYTEKSAGVKQKVSQGFFELLAAEKEAELARVRKEKKESEVADLEANVSAGLVERKTFLKTKSELLDLRLAALDAARKLDEKKRNLSTVLGIPSVEGCQLVESPETKTVSELEIAKLRAHPELCNSVKKAKLALDEKEKALSESHLGGGLEGNLSGEWNIAQGRQKVFSSFSGSSVGSIDTRRFNVSFTLSYPLWDGGVHRSQVRQAEAAWEATRLETKKAEAEAKNQLEGFLDKLAISQEKLLLLKEEVDLDERDLQTVDSLLTAGIAAQTDFLEAKIQAADAAQRYYQEKANYEVTRFEILKLFPPELPSQ